MKIFLKRTEAAKYLTDAGIPFSKNTLAKMAMDGIGPKYAIIRNKAYYRSEWLDNWLDGHFVSSDAIAHSSQERKNK